MKLPERIILYSILIGVLGLFLPIVVSVFAGITLQGSISVYYHTSTGWFYVSFLLLLTVFLFLYGEYPLKDEISFYEKIISDKGLSTIAGLCTLMMAIFPTKPGGNIKDTKIALLNKWYDYLVSISSEDIIRYIHLLATGLFFIIIILISLFSFTETKIGRWRIIFRACAVIMLVGFGLIIFDFLKPDVYQSLLFWGEFVALYGFSLSWIFKALTSSTYREKFGSSIKGFMLIIIVLLYVALIILLLIKL